MCFPKNSPWMLKRIFSYGFVGQKNWSGQIIVYYLFICESKSALLVPFSDGWRSVPFFMDKLEYYYVREEYLKASLKISPN